MSKVQELIGCGSVDVQNIHDEGGGVQDVFLT